MSETPRRFHRLLIANRGEIACRIIATARAMGLTTIAVYSEADRAARHLKEADEAVFLGPSRARDSYLNIERLIEAARIAGAGAVHPGYGFLSESADFARACDTAGLIFVGPTAGMIETMGSKSRAKSLMERAGVPLVPGYHGDAQDEATLVKAAASIGYPVLVKASAGGGGRGMRVVAAANELSAAITSARREAKAAFGDEGLLIEKYIQNPRHIEVQVVGDSHGNVVSLFERECTLQRRHQKVIEEAPSPTLSPAQRRAICAAARKAASAVNYLNAGTIEFVSDGKDFFFIEMNTRLQVEHPVTEFVTGIDLVEWQLRIAAGEKLPLRQDDIRLSGHAIEARVYAEDPARNFMPSVGRISTWHMPRELPGVRVDAGYESGSDVSPYYDAMLAKVISFGTDRATALDRLVAALDRTDIRGVITNTTFLAALLSDQDVRRNAIDTGFIERKLSTLTARGGEVGPLEIAAAVAAITSMNGGMANPQSPWRQARWIPAGDRVRHFLFRDGAATEHRASLRYGRAGMRISSGADEAPIEVGPADAAGFDMTLLGVRQRVQAIIEGRVIYVRTRAGRFELHWVDPLGVEDEDAGGSDRIVAPLPGTVVAVLAREGERLEKGAAIVTLEVMKMEQTLRAPFSCILKRLKCAAGDSVQEGVELAELEPL